MKKTLNAREVVKICQDGGADKARKTLMRLLLASSPESKAEQKHLLDGLLYVEMHEGRAKAALEVLRRRRALGYRKLEQRMDAALHAATLLGRARRFVDARAELMGIMRDPRSLHWDGLLPALCLYVDFDEQCREQMDVVLVEACNAVIKKFGIPLPFDGSARAVTQTIRDAQEMYRSDSRAYSELMCQVMTERTTDGRDRLISEIRAYPNEKRVEFFNDQARNLLDKLTSKNGDRATADGWMPHP